MKVLVIVAHPNLEDSKVNRAWVDELQAQQNNSLTIHELYTVYPNGEIDVEKEQKLAEEHDRIVFQFPLYWYSTPPILKKWQDVVLTYGWAFGSKGYKLKGKELILAISIGGSEDFYQVGGNNHFTISELTRPLQATANLLEMTMLKQFTFFGAGVATKEQIQSSARKYATFILNPELDPSRSKQRILREMEEKGLIS